MSEDLCFISSWSRETVSCLKLPGSYQLIDHWMSFTFSLGAKQPVCEADHPSAAEVKNEWCLPLFPHMPSWCATAAAAAAAVTLYHSLNIH